MLDKIIRKIEEEHLIKRYCLLIIAVFLSAVVYNLFNVPSHIVSGGSGGIAIICQNIFGITPSIMVLIVNAVTLIIGIAALGPKKVSGSIVATFLSPLFVDLTSGITNVIDIDNADMIMISLLIGTLGGIASGIIYKIGYSNGGIAVITKVLHERFRLPVGACSFILNAIIILAGGYLFGIERVLYAIIVIYVESLVIDRVLLGISQNKVFYIVTDKGEEIKQFLIEELGNGVTEFKSADSIHKKHKTTYMVTTPTRHYYSLSDRIKSIDKEAFFIVTDSYQTSLDSYIFNY